MKWSYSAHRSMRQCQRQYAFGQIVASHNATDPVRREAYILKQLKRIPAWQGDIVHCVLAEEMPSLIEQGAPIDSESLTAKARPLIHGQFAFSAKGKYRDRDLTKSGVGHDYCALYEHEYGQSLNADLLASVEAAIALCFNHLATQETLLEEIRGGRNRRFEQWLRFPLGEGTITVRIDLNFLAHTGKPTIIDWKVAKSEASDYEWQLYIYGWALARYGIWSNPDRQGIALYGVNLLRGTVQHYQMSSQRLDQIEDFVYRSMMEMKALAGTGKYADLYLDDLDVADKPGTCALCNFSKLCIQILEHGGRQAEAELVQGRLF